jgi:hypothetical protein
MAEGIMSASKAKGTAWESAIVEYLKENGVPHAERRALGGAFDRGDIAGLPGIVIEAKSASRFSPATWVAEAQAERDNDKAAYGFVWAKRVRKGGAGDGYVVMTGADLVKLLGEAGYIGTVRPKTTIGAADGGLLASLRKLLDEHEAVMVDNLKAEGR